jgi:hypothetical protein
VKVGGMSKVLRRPVDSSDIGVRKFWSENNFVDGKVNNCVG